MSAPACDGVTEPTASATARGAARLPAALGSLPVALLLLDADAMILHANRAAAGLLDLPEPRRGARRQSPFTRLLADAAAVAGLHGALQRAHTDGEVRVPTLTLRTPLGRELVAELRLTPHDRLARHTLATIIDRAGLAEAQADLRQRQAQLQAHERLAQRLTTAARLGATMIASCDAQQRVEWVNAAFEASTGWSVDEVRGLKLNVLQGPGTSPQAVATMRERLSAGRGFRALEMLNYRRDGQAYWAEVSVEPVLGEDGRIDGFVGVAQNIDARKRAERDLTERASLLRGVFDAAPDAAIVVQRDGSVAQANRRARELFARPAEVDGARGWVLRDSIGDDARAGFDAAFQRALFGAHQALELSTADGTVCSAKLWPLWRRAEAQAVLLVLVDQTELRAAEDRRRAVEATAAANQMHSEFLSRVSHELRTPLNAILGFAQLLDSGSRVSRAEMVQHIMQAGQHLLALIDDVLDLSSAASGELRVSLSDQRLAPAVHEVLALQAQAAQRARVTLTHDIASPDLTVRADAVRLRQVLTNLVSNAIKYNVPHGRVVVSAARQGERIEVAVSDTGIGLSPEQQQSLYQPFNRLGAERRRIGGTGIGLVVTRSLVQAMGGQLRVASAPGRGARFSFSLTAGRADAPSAATPRVLGLPSMHGAPGVANWADALPTTIAAPLGDEPPATGGQTPRRVLYIEDDPTNGLLVAAALRPVPGLQLRVAETIADGIDAFAQQPADVVLLDMHLPDGHGLQALDRLRRLPNWRSPPVIALSADAERRHIGDALAAGVEEYLTKPVVVSALLDTLQRALGVRKDTHSSA